MRTAEHPSIVSSTDEPSKSAPKRRHSSIDERRVLLCSIASDAHSWNLVYVQLLLEELGYQVNNLGPCTPEALIVDECVRTRPGVLVVSTVNGHGMIEGQPLARALRRHPRLHHLPMVIGGKLGVDGASAPMLQRLIDAGFDAVFDDSRTDLVEFTELVNRLTRPVADAPPGNHRLTPGTTSR
ncbi:cobalamin B12-binding domain-containing protein [Micromonospora sp. NPDC005299]|uniref:cobalamin B12-binding domain-containing protein n=1 Tax=Micromonospora sp. NPDC005299 TaxID=3364231 RepID=UPI0036A447B4